MNIITKAYVNFLSFLFEDSFQDNKISNKIKKQIVSSYCYKCEGACSKSCECRCHYRSCKKCDENDCLFKTCKCICHLPPDQLNANKLNPNNQNQVFNNIARRETRKLSLFQKIPEIKEKELKSNEAAGKFKKLFSNFKSIIEKDKKEAAEESRNKLILRFKKSNSANKIDENQINNEKIGRKPTSVVAKNVPVVSSTSLDKNISNENLNLQAANSNVVNDNNNAQNPSILNLGAPEVKARTNIWKNTLSKIKTNEPIINGRPNSADLSQKFTDVAKIKRKIQDIKLKGLDIKKSKEMLSNMNTNTGQNTSVTPKENLNLTNVSNNNSFDFTQSPIMLSVNSYLKDTKPNIGNLVPPIEPNNNSTNILIEPHKPHMKNKFDLNNTVLFYKKSMIVKDFEDFNLIAQDEKKVVNKNLQIEAKNIMGTSDAWQTYNSFLFGDNIHEIKIEPPEEKEIKSAELEKKETKKMINTSNTIDKKDSKKLITMSSTLKNKKTNV